MMSEIFCLCLILPSFYMSTLFCSHSLERWQVKQQEQQQQQQGEKRRGILMTRKYQSCICLKFVFETTAVAEVSVHYNGRSVGDDRRKFPKEIKREKW